ncbi:MAG: cytochrome b/b6 domain-containing protein [Cyanobacteriota bacterium]|nr:cytochrome b/b6 domain-containing protein [Cyanobacteriota bacterium]
MAELSNSAAASRAPQRRQSPSLRHSPIWTRVFHTLNIVVLLVMAGSGLQIYNANPVFGGRGGTRIPEFFTLGGWLAGGRHWHFGFMGLYAINLGIWIALLWSWRRPRLAVLGDVSTLGQSENIPKRRIAAHRLIYTLMLVVLSFSLITGLAMYKPASLWWLSGLFGSWHVLRLCHFATVPAMLALVMAHTLMSWRIGGLRFIRRMFA